MGKMNLAKRLNRTILIVGILTIGAMGMTACGKKGNAVATTAVETIEETKDFSMELTPSEKEEADEFRNSEQLRLSESLTEDGELVYTESITSREEETRAYTEDTIADIKTEWNSGNLTKEELQELINNILIYSTQGEKDELYNSLLASKDEPAKDTQVASNSTKPATTQQTKPAPTETQAPVVEPTKAAPVQTEPVQTECCGQSFL